MLAAALSIPDPRERPVRPGGGRPAEARPVRRRALRLRLLPQPLALSRRAAKGAVRQLVSADVPRGVPALPAHPGMAGPHRAAAQHRARHGHQGVERSGAGRPGARARGADRRAAVARRGAGGRDPGVRGRAQLEVRPRAGLGAQQAAAALDRRRRPGRDQQAVRPDRRAHRTGDRGTRRRASGPAHLQRAALGRQARRGDGLRARDALRPAAGGAPPRRVRRRSTRCSPGSCSSGTRWSRATGRPATTSSATTPGCSRNSPRSRSGPAAGTCWSATTRSTRSTTRACLPTSSRPGTSTRWWKKQRHRTPDLLTFTRDDLLRNDDADADRPDTWQAGDLSLPVTYRFEPGAADDGITVHVPVEVLARLGGDEFAWHVPALREELITALLRSLPKDLRRNFVPAPDTARAVLATLDPDARNRCWRRCNTNCAGARACWCRSMRSTSTRSPPTCA